METDTKPKTETPTVEMKAERTAGQEVAAAARATPRSAAVEHGEFSPTSLRDAMEFAQFMAQSGPMVPPHCRNQPGVCLGITLRALHWKADPFAVADKSCLVKQKKTEDDVGRIAYEASLIHAVIQKFGNLIGELETTYTGAVEEDTKQAGSYVDRRQITVRGKFVQNGVVVEREYVSPEVSRIAVKNSPLWVADIEQQLHYYGTRAWARRWRPGVILGVYTVEERMQEIEDEVSNADRARAIEHRGDALDDDPVLDPDEPPSTAPLIHRFSYALEQTPTDPQNKSKLQRTYLRFQPEVEATGPEDRGKLRGVYELHLRRLTGDVPHEEAMTLSRSFREPENG